MDIKVLVTVVLGVAAGLVIVLTQSGDLATAGVSIVTASLGIGGGAYVQTK